MLPLAPARLSTIDLLTKLLGIFLRDDARHQITATTGRERQDHANGRGWGIPGQLREPRPATSAADKRNAERNATERDMTDSFIAG